MKLKSIIWSIFGNLIVGALVVRGLFNKSWASTLPERLGKGGWSDVPSGPNVIWFHAASLGEVAGIHPVIAELKKQVPSLRFVVSTTSSTGRNEVLKWGIVGTVCYLPFDCGWVLRRVFADFHPALAVFAETELWPALSAQLEQRKVPTLLINARISDYTFPRYRRLRPWIQPVLETFTEILAQSEKDAGRLLELGAQPEKVVVNGSTKYDIDPSHGISRSREQLASDFGLDPKHPIFVAGSVRPGEEELTVDVAERLLAAVPHVQIVIAPRHPERFGTLAQLLSGRVEFSKRSQIANSSDPFQKRVLLLDTVGELRKCYAFSNVSFVGGSLVDIGGHNPLEPAAFGVPVLMGPFSNNYSQIVSEMKLAGALVEVNTGDQLFGCLCKFFEKPELLKESGEAARRVWEANRGATKRVVEQISSFISVEQFPGAQPLAARAAGN